MKNKSTLIWVVIGIVALAGIIWASAVVPNQPDKLDNFATCLKDKGATFYGAFWCPHCQNQKAAFGRSERLLPYVECSNPDGQSQTQICIDKGIKSYPTWRFKDGSELNGEIPLETLAQKTGCTLPPDYVSPEGVAPVQATSSAAK